MRTTPKTYVVLLVLFALACVAAPAASATTGTGGTASGASASTPTSTPLSGLGTSEIATWFGPGLYGKHTACGQTLTPKLVGVANRTLPCGTLIQVTYSGHSLTVPVLDRGPYGHGASWDLTAGAAQALGITETVRIGARVVGKAANNPALGLPAGTSPAASPSPASTTGGASPSGGAAAG